MSKKQLVKSGSVRKASSPVLSGPTESNPPTDSDLPHVTSFITQNSEAPVVEPVADAARDAPSPPPPPPPPRAAERSPSVVGRSTQSSDATAKKRRATSPAVDPAKVLVSLQEAHAEAKVEFERTAKSLADMTALYERASERLEHLEKECAAMSQVARESRDAKLAAEREVSRASASQHAHIVEIKNLRAAVRQTERLLEQSNLEVKNLRETVQYQPPCEYCTRTREEGEKYRKQNKELRHIIERMEEEERQQLPLAERVRPLNKTNQTMKQQNLDLLSKLSAFTDKEKMWQKERAEMAAAAKHLQVQLNRATSHEHRVMELEVQNQLLLTMLQKKGSTTKGSGSGGVGGEPGPMASLQRDRHMRPGLSPVPSASSGKPPRVLPPLIQSNLLDQPPPARVPRARGAPPATVVPPAAQATPSRISRISSISSTTSQRNIADVVEPDEGRCSSTSPQSREETPVAAPGSKQPSSLGQATSKAVMLVKEKSAASRSQSPSPSSCSSSPPRDGSLSSNASTTREAGAEGSDAVALLTQSSAALHSASPQGDATATQREASGQPPAADSRSASRRSTDATTCQSTSSAAETQRDHHNDDIDVADVAADQQHLITPVSQQQSMASMGSDHNSNLINASIDVEQQQQEKLGSRRNSALVKALSHDDDHSQHNGANQQPIFSERIEGLVASESAAVEVAPVDGHASSFVKSGSDAPQLEQEDQEQHQPPAYTSQGSYENDASFEATSATEIPSVGGIAEREGVAMPVSDEQRDGGDEHLVDDDVEATVTVHGTGPHQVDSVPAASNEPSWLDD